MSAADQGAWAASIGAFAAAIAAVGIVFYQGCVAKREKKARAKTGVRVHFRQGIGLSGSSDAGEYSMPF